MWRRITHSVWANVILAVLAVACFVGAVSLARSAVQVSRGFAAARARMQELAAEKDRLEGEIRERTQEESVRYQAKARLNLKNPGEEIVVVLPDKPEVFASAKGGAWQRIKNFLRRLLNNRFFGI